MQFIRGVVHGYGLTLFWDRSGQFCRWCGPSHEDRVHSGCSPFQKLLHGDVCGAVSLALFHTTPAWHIPFPQDQWWPFHLLQGKRFLCLHVFFDEVEGLKVSQTILYVSDFEVILIFLPFWDFIMKSVEILDKSVEKKEWRSVEKCFFFQTFQKNAKVVSNNQVSEACQQEEQAEHSPVCSQESQCCRQPEDKCLDVRAF